MFPAWAGMNRVNRTPPKVPVRVPRVGGDEPIEVKITEAPREWKKDSELRMSLKGKITAVPMFNGVPAYVPKV